MLPRVAGPGRSPPAPGDQVLNIGPFWLYSAEEHETETPAGSMAYWIFCPSCGPTVLGRFHVRM